MGSTHLEALDVAAVVGRYARTASQIPAIVVGEGYFGLVARWSDGSRTPMYFGFESVAHAEIFAAYRDTVEGVGPAPSDPPVEPDLEMGGGIATIPPHVAHLLAHMGVAVVSKTAPETKRLGFDVVALTLAAPIAALEAVRGGSADARS